MPALRHDVWHFLTLADTLREKIKCLHSARHAHSHDAGAGYACTLAFSKALIRGAWCMSCADHCSSCTRIIS